GATHCVPLPPLNQLRDYLSVPRCSHRLFSKDGHAAQQPALGGAEIGARMQRTAIVPHDEIVRTPHVLVDELALLLMIKERVQKLVALALRQALDGHSH